MNETQHPNELMLLEKGVNGFLFLGSGFAGYRSMIEHDKEGERLSKSTVCRIGRTNGRLIVEYNRRIWGILGNYQRRRRPASFHPFWSGGTGKKSLLFGRDSDMSRACCRGARIMVAVWLLRC